MSKETTEDQNKNDLVLEASPEIRKIVTAIWSIIIILTICTGLNWDIANIINLDDMSVSDQALVFIPIILFALSIIAIPLDKIASVTFFGYPVCNLLPGPKIIPIFLFRVKRYERGAQQEQFPGDPEEIYKGPDDTELPEGMKRPLRITTGKPERADKNNPLAIQMGLEFIYFLRVQIRDPLLFQVKYGDMDQFWRQVRDTGDKVLTSQVSQMPGVAKLIEKTNELMSQLDTELETLCLKGGVEVIESGMSAPDLTHDLSAALRDIGKIRANAGAKAGEIRQIKAAEADMAAMLINKTSQALSEADGSAKAAYVGEKVLSDKTTIIGTQGISQLVGLAQVLTEGIKKGGESK